MSENRTPPSWNPSIVGQNSTEQTVRLSEVLAGLSYALDLTEGQREGHAVRTCLIGMRLAEAIGLPRRDRSSLFYALLMKDLGCSSNAARFAALFAADDHGLKHALKTIDWSKASESFRFVTRSVAPGAFWLKRVWQTMAVLSRGPEGAREVVRTRCERGADIAKMLGFNGDTVSAIRALDEHWDGGGQPYGLKGDEIPLMARILGLAQTVEVFYSTYGVLTAYDMAAARRGRWFEPALVDALLAIRADGQFWKSLDEGDPFAQLKAVEPADRVILAGPERLDLVAEAFAKVIDAKSPWTFKHSNGVAELSVAMGARLGLQGSALIELRRAALLHDLGKLGVSSLILDKPGKLTDDEFAAMRAHPSHTRDILSRVGCFANLVDVAASHHEKLDGSGYHRRLDREQLPMAARIVCVADICDALRASRPYREGLPAERVIDIMSREAGTALDADCFDAMRHVLLDSTTPVLQAPAPAVRVVPGLDEDYRQAA
jgi:HD-GYP domain-containing protein (c-di-GMP phosphodiesterase class II)